MSLKIEYQNSGYTDSITNRQNLIRAVRQDLARNGENGAFHIERIERSAAGFVAHVVPGIPDTRPNAQVVSVPRSISLTEANLNRFADTLREKGRTVADVDFIGHTIITAEISPATREVRDRLAYALGVKPYDIDVTATWDPEVGIDAIYIKRLPALKDEDATRSKLLAALPQVGGSVHWNVAIAPIHAAARLTYKQKDSLPELVSLDDVLPKSVDPTRWKKVLLGVDPSNRPFYQDLTGTPHVLSQGPTGSGKTVALTALCASHLMNGASIVIGDAIKGGGDFKGLQPFCLGWADSLEAVADAVQQVYEEGQRRKAVLLKIGKVKVADCSPEEVEKYKLSPLVVLLDEFGSLVIPLDVPKGADKEDPLVQEATAQNNAKTSIKLYCGKIARELRFVSVFLIIATQVAQVAIVGSGEFRSNLGMKIQSAPKAGSISSTDLGMLFDPGMMDSVRERIQTLSDGNAGLTIVAAEGGLAQGVRPGYAKADHIETLMHERGVPVVTKPMRLKQGAKTIEAATLPQWWTDAVEEEETANTTAPVDSAPEPAWASAEDPF